MKKLQYYFIILCFAGFGIFSFIPGGQIITISYRMIIIAISFIMIISLLDKNHHKFSIRKVAILIIPFLIFYLYRLISDLYFTTLDFGRSSEDILMLAILVSFVPAFALSTVRDNKILIKVIDPLIKLFTLIGFLAILSGLIFGFQYRLAGNDILNAIALGHFSTSGLILIVVSYFTINKKERMSNIQLSISFMILLLTLFMSASRGPMLSLVLALGFFLPSYIKFNFKTLFLAIPSLIIVIIGILQFSESSSSILTDRFKVDLGDDGGDGEARVLLWATGFMMFLNNPIFGIHTTMELGYPHNIFIEVLMGMGIVGGIIFLLIIWFSFKKLRLLKKLKTPLIWPGLLFIQYLLGALLSGTLYSSTYFWYSVGMLFAINYKKIKTRRQSI